jgi:hypothetical protein
MGKGLGEFHTLHFTYENFSILRNGYPANWAMVLADWPTIFALRAPQSEWSYGPFPSPLL